MSIWGQAKSLAAQTPEARNRYVDFLRAISILVVITGHWIIATAYFADGAMQQGHLLKSHPQTQWLTWIFQVMPVFFIVGGYANAVSLDSARSKKLNYASWLSARLTRLVTPLMVLMLFWAIMAVAMSALGARPATIQYASQAALIPTWFLAIYIMVAILAPTTYAFWQRHGFISFWVFASAAILTDALFFLADVRWPGWSNYFWVWLAVHQLGYAWRHERTGSIGRLLLYASLGFIVLWSLIQAGPYPLAMVGSPDEGLSNTLPPKVTLIALGVVQFGVLLALEKPMRQMLSGLRLWTVTVLINSMIMTIYLWHITIMIVFVALLFLAGGVGLEFLPGSQTWWITRPFWILVLMTLLVPVALLLSPLERRARAADLPVPSAVRQIVGAVMLCLGVALLAMYGYSGGPLQMRDVASISMIIVGAGIVGLLPGRKRWQR